MKIYYLEWEYRGKKEHRVSPFMPSKGHAIYWLRGIKPEILQCLETLIIRQHRTDDPR